MAKVLGARERRHQPYWDTLIRGTAASFQPRTAASLASSPIKLFRASNTGDIAITNMDSSGQFPSDQTFRVMALRVWLHFRGVGSAGGLTDHIMYHRASTQLWWQLTVQNKEAFVAPTPYLPMGGGLHGDVGSSTDVYFNNGTPSQQATAKLARSISLSKRQNFEVACTISAVGATNFATDMAAVNAGEVDIRFFLDGLHVRDIL
jgi:hypothetical protein